MEHKLEETGAILYLCKRSLASSPMLLGLFSGLSPANIPSWDKNYLRPGKCALLEPIWPWWWLQSPFLKWPNSWGHPWAFSPTHLLCVPIAEAGLQGGASETMLMDLRSAVGVYVHVPEDSCLGQTTVARDEDTVYICIEPCGIQSF